MDYRTIKTLLMIADCGSFTEAGTRLGVTAASVSQQIRRLETDTGVLLFDRTRRPPTLSQEGREFVLRARQAVQQWEKFCENFAESRQHGLIKIGAIGSAVLGPLPSALARYTGGNTRREIHLVAGHSLDLHTQLLQRQLDLAVIASLSDWGSGIQFLSLCRQPLVCVAHREVPGEQWQALLQAKPFIHYHRSLMDTRRIDDQLAADNIHVTARFEVETAEAALALVEAQLGVAVIPKPSTPLGPLVRSLPFGQPQLTRELGIAWHRDTLKDHLIQPLIQEIAQAYRDS